MSRRRLRRRDDKARRHAPVAAAAVPQVTRTTDHVERLAYTITQAAQALGVSRSTFYRLLPSVETVELPWGTKLVPVDELERLLRERRQPARRKPEEKAQGRPRTVPPEVVVDIRTM